MELLLTRMAVTIKIVAISTPKGRLLMPGKYLGGWKTMDFRIRPLADRVVIRPQPKEEVTRGGIFLPDTASKEKPQEGTVMAVGEGRLDDNGRRTPVAVKAGDRVLFAKYAGTEVRVEDEEFLILAEKDILGVVNE